MLKPLLREKLLAVEGMDEIVFFEELLKYIGLADSIDLVQVGGKDQFKIKMPALQKTSGFLHLNSIAIIRDADKNGGGAFISIKKILEKMNLQPPDAPGMFSSSIPRVGVFIIPDNVNQGMLESLCIETVKDKAAMRCVNDFINCSQQLEMKPHNIDKAKAHAYLSIMPEIANSIGRGAQKGHWNFDDQALKPLIGFLSKM